MKTLLQFLLLFLLLLASTALRAQVGVGTTTPDSKAALDIQAADKGLLIPRLTAGQRTGIANPPQGLMVYQTDGTPSGGLQSGFWYYAGAPAQWVFLDPTPNSGGLTLPYSGTYSGVGNAFGVSNTGIGAAIVATATLSAAVSGTSTSSGTGVAGASVVGTGVRGSSSGAGVGVSGSSATGVAMQAQKAAAVPLLGIPGQTGRVAEFTNNHADNDSTALYASSVRERPALRAVNTSTSGQAAIRGVKQAAAPDGSGVEGVITSGASGNAAGVRGLDQSGASTGSGVLGQTTGGSGVRGRATGSNGYGVRGEAAGSSGYGVFGTAAGSNGIAVAAQAGGPATAIYGLTTGTGRAGYFGQNNASSSAAVLEIGQSGTGPVLLLSAGTRPAEVNSTATGAANLLPVAYGRVGPTGAVLSGTGNFTVVQNVTGLGSYTITLTGMSGVNFTNAICQVTPRFGTLSKPNQTFAASANGGPNGRIDVHISDLTAGNNLEEQGFSFVVYQP
ncbi:hypothetical protein J0X19_06650 [Hymenobacter sp. BT186]|uniref:Collagen-like protein n=1 Tax=Hymenobacter telluris TaxID=2816474 RepID=A0A939EUE0_9BACT|nr:hypothetical protein [Hymenobacter telluris]MBO0357618.1 hypothetical protein [Hymenobacter telluris]MBW3373644.1 hypothetical protein [Hymenobacter norwichensis]